MNSTYYIGFAILLFAANYFYFGLARKYNIIDIPNHRTMHEGATIRGGGIVIYIAMCIYTFFAVTPGYFFLAGLLIIGITGFMDDIIDLSGKIRLPLQTAAVIFILAELQLFSPMTFLIFIIIIIATGTLNAYNFMDGINGITGGYSMVLVTTLLYINNFLFFFISNDFLIFFLLTIVVFNYFNFRKKAVCFAGDVGSLTIAYIIVYLIIKLCIESHQLIFILLLTLYGIDTVFTIIQRIFRKENIFDAHRLHLFQVLVSKTKMPHLKMSGIYMTIQLVINIAIITISTFPGKLQLFYISLMIFVLSIAYIFIKKKIMLTTL